jgi:putative addiction module component (TIGR02574 family)
MIEMLVRNREIFRKEMEAMSPEADQILLEALKLAPVERAELVEQLLESFSFPDRKAIDEVWAAEAEGRIDAFDRGDLKSRPASRVLDRIKQGAI